MLSNINEIKIMNQTLSTLFFRAMLLMATLVAFNAAALETRDGVQHVGSDNIQVLDVRTAEEFAEGHIEGAVNIDYYADDFAAQLKSLDPNKQYVVHCRSGVRSGRSLPILKSAGVTKLIHLDGGIKAWMSADLPLE